MGRFRNPNPILNNVITHIYLEIWCVVIDSYLTDSYNIVKRTCDWGYDYGT